MKEEIMEDLLIKNKINLSDQQKIQIVKFKERHPEVGDAVALKFHLGRKFVPEKVEECYENYLRLVKENNYENISLANVLQEMKTNKLCIPGTRDREDAALFILNAAKHVPGQFPREDTLKLAFYMAEVLTAEPRTAQVGITVISNMEGMEWSNFELDFQRSVIDLFQANIPARVKNILLYRCPWWVTMIVKMVSPFLKQKMRERIHIVEEGGLDQWIEKDQLPTELGGTFEYSHENFIQKQMHLAELGISHLSVHSLNTAATAKAHDEHQNSAPPDTPLEIQKTRQSIIDDLDARIREHEENMKNKTLPADIVRILQTRAMRMSVDYSEFPSMEPNIVHYGLRPIEEMEQEQSESDSEVKIYGEVVEVKEEKTDISMEPVKRRIKREGEDRRKMRTAFFGGEGAESAFSSHNIASNVNSPDT